MESLMRSLKGALEELTTRRPSDSSSLWDLRRSFEGPSEKGTIGPSLASSIGSAMGLFKRGLLGPFGVASIRAVTWFSEGGHKEAARLPSKEGPMGAP